MKGYIIAYCTNAYAIENGSADMREEEKRKVRIAAGGLQSIRRLRPLLNPFRYGVLSFQYTSHRVEVVCHAFSIVRTSPAECCDFTDGRFACVLRRPARVTGVFLRTGILGILSVYQTDKE